MTKGSGAVGTWQAGVWPEHGEGRGAAGPGGPGQGHLWPCVQVQTGRRPWGEPRVCFGGGARDQRICQVVSEAQRPPARGSAPRSGRGPRATCWPQVWGWWRPRGPEPVHQSWPSCAVWLKPSLWCAPGLPTLPDLRPLRPRGEASGQLCRHRPEPVSHAAPGPPQQNRPVP